MSPGALEVSPARPEEYAALGALTVAAYASVDASLGAGYAEVLADVAGRAGQPGAVVLAARRDGVPVGCATVVLGSSPLAGDLAPGTAVVRMVGVAPAAQGSGVGRALVKAALDLARAEGRRVVDLHTQPVMRAAQRLYASLGFVRRPEADRQIPDGPRLMAYRLHL